VFLFFFKSSFLNLDSIEKETEKEVVEGGGKWFEEKTLGLKQRPALFCFLRFLMSFLEKK